MKDDRDLGPQPLIKVMEKLKVTTKDLVAASDVQLSFKVVGKACKGRRLTVNSQQKVLSALRALHPDADFNMKDIFNY